MSLTTEEYLEAHKLWAEMDKRLKRLIGFNPATSNHYGKIQLYNHRINHQTSDAEILKLHEKYLCWQVDIFQIFEDNNITLTDEQFNKLFSYDGMFGTISFLGKVLDISKDMEYYRELVEGYIDERQEL